MLSFGVPILMLLIRRARLQKTKEFASLTPRDFVSFVALVYQRLGYRTTITEGLNDKGADIVLKRDGETTVVQVKHWNKPVGMSAVREVVAAKPHYGATNAVVVCSRNFSPRAEDLAKDNRVQLVDGMRLAKMKESHSS